MTPISNEVVSSDLEDLILVNSDDESLGTRPKRECHLDQGALHRAFSVFIFNSAGDVLLQQRTAQNSCGRCTGRTRAAVTQGQVKTRKKRRIEG